MAVGRSHVSALRRVVGVAAALVLIISVLVIARSLPKVLTASTSAASGASSPGSSAGPVTPTASELPAPTQESPSPTPNGADTPETPDAPNAPNALTAGIGLTATTRVDGTFDVVEKVTLADPISSLTLRPPQISPIGDAFAQLKPEAVKVQVRAGDRSVAVPSGRVRASTTLALPAPTRTVELRYRLQGVTKRSVPSTDGRALAGVAPLIGDVPDDLPVAVSVPGRSVRNLSCPTLPVSAQSCVTGGPGRMRVDPSLPWKTAVVLVQLDLGGS